MEHPRTNKTGGEMTIEKMKKHYRRRILECLGIDESEMYEKQEWHITMELEDIIEELYRSVIAGDIEE